MTRVSAARSMSYKVVPGEPGKLLVYATAPTAGSLPALGSVTAYARKLSTMIALVLGLMRTLPSSTPTARIRSTTGLKSTPEPSGVRSKKKGGGGPVVATPDTGSIR